LLLLHRATFASSLLPADAPIFTSADTLLSHLTESNAPAVAAERQAVRATVFQEAYIQAQVDTLRQLLEQRRYKEADAMAVNAARVAAAAGAPCGPTSIGGAGQTFHLSEEKVKQLQVSVIAAGCH